MIKICLVGLGGMGTVHWNNYRFIDNCKVVAAVGCSDQDRKNAQEWGIPLFDDIEDMLAATSVDVVDVCTPTFLHYEHVLQALSNGINTFVEKPIALHREQAETLYQTAEKNNALLLVGQALRFTREYAILKELVVSGRYGKPLDGYFERLSAAPLWAAGGWMFDKNKSGHLAFDLHIHDLDLIVSIFGKPASYSYTSAGNESKDYKEQYRLTYKYDNLNISAEAAWFNADIPFTARWRVYFENAMVINDGNSVTAYQFGHDPLVFDTEESTKVPTGINLPPTAMFLHELSHFIDCVRGKKQSEIIKKEEIFTVLEILENISFNE